jgi:GNAT superfamily N-acetyltransferase
METRAATPADYAGAFAVFSAAYPGYVTTEAGFRHDLESLPPQARLGAWVAVEGETIVGWSRARTRHEESGGSANVGVSVLPEHRRRGIGTALLSRVLDHVAAAPRIFTFTPESGREFAEAHGFHLTGTSRLSALDPRLVDASELERSDVELRRLDEIGPEQVFAVDSVAALDVPEEEPPDLMKLDQWLLGTWENPDFDWASGAAAWVDGRAVAISYPAVDLPGRRAANAFTGTLPEFRSRGLARLVKLAVIRRLAELDVELLLTINHDVNTPMLAVNERLGFRPHGAHFNYVRASGNGLRASAGST